MSADQDFPKLLERVRAGSEAALAELVERHGDVIRRSAHAMLGPLLRPHLDTMDLFQSLHRTLLIGLRDQKFDVSTPEKLIALTATLLRRKVARHWRKLRHQSELISSQVDPNTQPAEANHDAVGADPAQVLSQTDEVQRLLASLDQLDRRLLELRLVGHSTADAARQLGIEPAIMRVRLARLRRRLLDEGLLDGMV